MAIEKKPKNIGKIISQGILQVFLLVWALIQIFPLYWLLTISLKDNSEIFGGNIVGLPSKLLFENYKNAFLGAKAGTYLLNSIIVTTAAILLTAVFSMSASYALTRMRWKYREATFLLFSTGLMIPIHAALLPVFLIMRQLKLINTHWSLIIPYVAFGIPMAIIVFTGFMQSIPRDLEEAACIDGCGVYRIFLFIMAPLLKPALATISIFTFIQSWNELMFAVVFISKQELKTLTVGIQSMSGKYYTDWGSIGAALVVATLPTLIIYLFMSKQVQKSLVVGAVKG